MLYKKNRQINFFFLTRKNEHHYDTLKSQITAWKWRKLLSHFLGKNFVKVTFFTKETTKELISRLFFVVRENFSFFHTVNSLVIVHCALVSQKCRESKVVSKEINQESISRNIFR